MQRVLRLGRVSPKLEVPSSILHPPYAATGQVSTSMTAFAEPLKGAELAKMREACRQARAALDHIVDQVEREVTAEAGEVAMYKGQVCTTDLLDRELHRFVVEELRSYPSPLMYSGFPKSVCTSVNDVICHGIPDDVPLVGGDQLNLDVSVYTADGYHGDNSAMVTVGPVKDSTRFLIDRTKEAMQAGIDVCGPGVPFSEIGMAITKSLEGSGLAACPDFTGHGIAKEFHTRPWIIPVPNLMEPGRMEEGHVFTIEPAVVAGSVEHFMAEDGWTVFSKDGAHAAQWEETLVVTSDGYSILTAN